MEPLEEIFALTSEQRDMFRDYLHRHFVATASVYGDEIQDAPVAQRMMRDYDLLCELEELSNARDWFSANNETYSEVKGVMLALIHALFAPVPWNYVMYRLLRPPECVYATPRTGWEGRYTREEKRADRVCVYIRERKLRALLA